MNAWSKNIWIGFFLNQMKKTYKIHMIKHIIGFWNGHLSFESLVGFFAPTILCPVWRANFLPTWADELMIGRFPEQLKNSKPSETRLQEPSQVRQLSAILLLIHGKKNPLIWGLLKLPVPLNQGWKKHYCSLQGTHRLKFNLFVALNCIVFLTILQCCILLRL